MRLTSALAGVVLLLGACSPSASESAAPSASSAVQAAVHPVSGLRVISLTVTHNGKRHDFRVEVANSGLEQAKGLMFRTEMGPDEGMIFPLKPPRVASFWMKNTVLPLDIIFIDGNGVILNIAANTVPYDENSVYSEGIAHAVLELNGGRAAQLGIAPGDKVNW
ncbi:MAG: DUF192 domain-containing protein [Novosphingobium sp.]|nr:DUF192 domain-containing protein [Novosphingobium sp.]